MLTIIYEDADILVVDKPAGVAVHPDAHHVEGTLLDEVRAAYPEAELAHRLDKDTSGLLLAAKHAKAYAYLKDLFKERKITKKYLALVAGKVAKNEGVIDLEIGRSKKDFRKRVSRTPLRQGYGRARAAETHFKVVERFQGYTLLEVTPKTGRTHQIRSHFSSIGHPVVCDSLYGGKRLVCPEGLTRQFLHAYSLEFTAPSGTKLRLEAELPEDLSHVLEDIAK